VTRSGDQIRFAVQLVSAVDGRSVWSNTFQRRPSELVSLQQDVASSVSRAIGTTLGTPAASADKTLVNPEAYDLYLRARYHAGRLDEPDLDQAIGLLERSTQLDPRFVLGQA